MIDDTQLYSLLGENIRKYRKLKNLSQDNLAYESGVNRAYIGYMERAEKRPSIRIVNKIAQKYAGTCPTISVPAEQLEAYVISFAKNLLTNPQAAYDYQLKLRSTKLRKKHLETERNNLVKNINYAPQRIDNLKDQQEHGHISIDELTEKLKIVEKEAIKWQSRLKEVDRVLGKYELSVGYVKSFNQYAKKYSKAR